MAKSKKKYTYPYQRLIDISVAEDIIDFDPITQNMFWKHRASEYFKDPNRSFSWNAKNEGKQCFNYLDVNGYLRGVIFKHKIPKHRLIWLFSYGRWPNGFIDHINGIKTDNRLVNLREVTSKENSKNRAISKSNSTGHMNVYNAKRQGAYRVAFCIDGKYKSLGVYDNIQDAVDVRNKNYISMGFNENHGRCK